MRVAVYNQMFGLNGRSFWSNVFGHWAVHYQTDPKRIWKRSNLSNTVKLISESNADVVGIIEVLEGQEEDLKKELRIIGYEFFYIGRGHKTKYGGLCVQEMVASKIKMENKIVEFWPMENKIGGGGGFIHVFCKESGTDFILVHLGLPSRKIYRKQLDFLQGYLKKLKGKVVLFGDFNHSCSKLESCFEDYNLVSGGIRTCSNTPIMKWFYNKDVDHIFVRDVRSRGSSFLCGNSDHKLIYADLE
jgi:endonuclease/exonuclease/phosphatase family metal-dependent hydrolase